MVIASILLTVIMKVPHQVLKMTKKVQSRAVRDYRISRALNQIESDISSACMPELFSQELIEDKSKDNPETNKSEKTKTPKPTNKNEPSGPKDSKAADSKAADSEEKEKIIFFKAEVDDDKTRSNHFDDNGSGRMKRMQMLKKLTMFNTNPLVTYEQTAPRLIKVGYELIKDKNASTRTTDIYQLWRVENKKLAPKAKKKSSDIFSTEDEEPEDRIMILNNIHECFFEFTRTDSTKKEDSESPVETVSEWGNDEKTNTILPDKISVMIALGETDGKSSIPYSFTIPIFSNSLSSTNDSSEDKTDKRPKESKVIRPGKEEGSGEPVKKR
jgi:hypothetical protein